MNRWKDLNNNECVYHSLDGLKIGSIKYYFGSWKIEYQDEPLDSAYNMEDAKRIIEDRWISSHNEEGMMPREHKRILLDSGRMFLVLFLIASLAILLGYLAS